MSRLYALLLVFGFLLSNQIARATHAYNYTYSYVVIDYDSSTGKNLIEFKVQVLNDCYLGQPSSLISDLLMGIYANTGGQKVAEVQLVYQSNQDLSQYSDSIGGSTCFSISHFKAQTWLDRNTASKYIAQINTCCFANSFVNLGVGGVFHEFHIPSGLDSGFHSSSSSIIPLYLPALYSGVYLNFQDDPGSFDSVRYELTQGESGPGAFTNPVYYVAPSRVNPALIPFKTGYTVDQPLGINWTHNFSDTGTLYVQKIEKAGIYQIPVRVKSYRNGKAYQSFRYLTIIPRIKDLASLTLTAKSTLPKTVELTIKKSNFNQFQFGEVYRRGLHDSTGFQKIGNFSSSDTTYIDTNVMADSVYHYYLNGLNASDTVFSNSATVRVILGIPKITLTAALIGADIQLDWTSEFLSASALYHVQRGTDTINFTSLILSPTKSYLDKSLNQKTTYYYRIYNRLVSGDTAISNWDSIFYPNPNGLDFDETTTRVYPNPSTGILLLESQKTGPFALYDLSGNILLRGVKEENTTQIDLTGLKAGLYILRFNQEAIKVYVE